YYSPGCSSSDRAARPSSKAYAESSVAPDPSLTLGLRFSRRLTARAALDVRGSGSGRRRMGDGKAAKMPGPWTRGLPLIGNLLEVMRLDFHRLLLQWANTYGGVYRQALRQEGAIHQHRLANSPCPSPSLSLTQPVPPACCTAPPSAASSGLTQLAPWGKGLRLQLAGSSSPIQQPGRAAGVLAVAVAFSLQNIKKKYPVIRSCSERLIGQLAGLLSPQPRPGRPAIVVDVDQAALRVTLDVIGLVCPPQPSTSDNAAGAAGAAAGGWSRVVVVEWSAGGVEVQREASQVSCRLSVRPWR
ncbi:hypothetical protein QJQ45_025543, partial [Haematococcus lacustris]